VTNAAPVVDITAPTSGQDFFESQIIPLRVTVTDDGWGTATPPENIDWYVDNVYRGSGAVFNYTHSLSVGPHNLEARVTDGLLTTSDFTSFDVVADPVNLPPSVTITSPGDGSHYANQNTPLGYQFTANASASDPDGPTPTINWYTKRGTNARVFLGTGTSRSVFLAWNPPGGDCFAGTPYQVIAEVSDGTTTTSDLINKTVLLLC
jgi:hypothetical protein